MQPLIAGLGGVESKEVQVFIQIQDNKCFVRRRCSISLGFRNLHDVVSYRPKSAFPVLIAERLWDERMSSEDRLRIDIAMVKIFITMVDGRDA